MIILYIAEALQYIDFFAGITVLLLVNLSVKCIYLRR